jgi:hypothetical protein
MLASDDLETISLEERFQAVDRAFSFLGVRMSSLYIHTPFETNLFNNNLLNTNDNILSPLVNLPLSVFDRINRGVNYTGSIGLHFSESLFSCETLIAIGKKTLGDSLILPIYNSVLFLLTPMSVLFNLGLSLPELPLFCHIAVFKILS